MARDYSKKRPARRQAPVPKKWPAVILSFLCGYVIASLFDITSLYHWTSHHFSKPPVVPPVAVVQKPIAPKPKPKFEFYTLLSKDRLALDTMAPKQPPLQTKTPESVNLSSGPAMVPGAAKQARQAIKVVESKPVDPIPSANKETFLIQIASFNRRQDAENLRASLMLRGVDAAIVVTAQGTTSWFRVVAGPFHSKIEAEKAQSLLARNEHIKGIIRKNDV